MTKQISMIGAVNTYGNGAAAQQRPKKPETHVVFIRPHQWEYQVLWNRIKVKWIQRAREEGLIPFSEPNPDRRPTHFLVEVNVSDGLPYMAEDGSWCSSNRPVPWDKAQFDVWWPMAPREDKARSAAKTKERF